MANNSQDNPRFSSYCPFCQYPSSRPSERPQDPPAYSSPPRSPELDSKSSAPPAYSLEPPQAAATPTEVPSSSKSGTAKDVLHFVDPAHDSSSSLSLRYGVPLSVFRQRNNLFADHLLAARRTVLIPGEFYKGGVSLSPKPVGGEEEELRKSKVRRWMVACKVAEYDMALIYLQQAKYDLETAVEAYQADERWEREHPMASGSKRK
ncbi:MAG: hypothetical protein M4579_007510 [Chaenotheca gracillima]|nr:MAG: hypothetical protein M4579_007510 [Chaenotheca gracillima]